MLVHVCACMLLYMHVGTCVYMLCLYVRTCVHNLVQSSVYVNVQRAAVFEGWGPLCHLTYSRG